ncbi:hypothetical protein AHAS_Ahas15G0328600 [Arachis hypogaea]
MEDTKAFWLDYGGKNSWFDYHRRYLPEGHPYRRNKVGVKKNVEEDEEPPIRLSGEQVWERVRHYPKIVDTVGQVRLSGYGVEHNWTKRSIFWDLPYWKDHLVRHCLDLMHIEKNIFYNIMNTVMDTERIKDNEKARLDMAVLCKRPDLNLVQVREGHWAKPKSNYVLTLQQ